MEPPICSAVPSVISPDGCVQIRPIWCLFGRRDTTAHAGERTLTRWPSNSCALRQLARADARCLGVDLVFLNAGVGTIKM